MNKWLFGRLAVILAISFPSFAGEERDQDPYRVGYMYDHELPSLALQQAIESGPVWQAFLAEHPDWMAVFDQRTALPHRAYGPPFHVGPANKATILSFLTSSFANAGLPLNELEYLTKTETAEYEHVILQQRHQGMLVRNARADFKFTRDGRLILLGLDIHPEIALPSGSELPLSALTSMAALGVPNVTRVDFIDYFIYPFPGEGAYDYRKIAEFTVHSEQTMPAIYTTYVDVMDGTVLFRENQIHQLQNDTTHVRGNVRTGKVFHPQTLEPFRRVRVEVDGTTYSTDDQGNLAAPLVNLSSIVVHMQGDWVSVREYPATSPVFSGIMPGNLNPDTLDISSLFTVEARSAYYHTDIVHDHMKQYFPNFSELDLPLPCRIEITPHLCNAFYNGSSINFYVASNSCYSLAQVKDVVYHEYGHAINDHFYSSNGVSFSNRGMHEGYADIWGISITADSILAQGTDPGDTTRYIRRYDQGIKVYPDNWSGQMHNDGEIIAGSFWDSYRYTGLSMDSITKIWTQSWFGLPMQPYTLSGTGQLYYDVLLEMLMADDVVANGGDNDITNGTPNGSGIVRGFTDHGISLMGIIDLTHMPADMANINQPIMLEAQANVQFNQYFGQVTVRYRINRVGPWSTVPMSLVSGTTYEGQIPGQPAGTIIDYYITLDDVNGVPALEAPFKVSQSDPLLRNLAYNVLVGYNRMHIEDFDFNQDSWIEGLPSDNATTGHWIIDLPSATYDNYNPGLGEVQPGTQHTPGGSICAVTGNNGNGISIQDDVDNGETNLVSPDLDLTGYDDPIISYYRWFSNNTGINPGTDPWIVYISNDGGANWVEVENTRAWDQSWRRAVHRVADFVTPNATVSLRFVASDYDPVAIVEAAIDDVEIWEEADISIKEHDVTYFNVYPNPTTDQLTLDFDLVRNTDVDVQVLDVIGRLLLEQSIGSFGEGNHKARLGITHLAKGTYQLVLRTDGALHTKTFVKQ